MRKAYLVFKDSSSFSFPSSKPKNSQVLKERERKGLRFTWEAFQKYLISGLIYGGTSIVLAIVLFYLFRTYVLYKVSVESFSNVTGGDKNHHLMEFIPIFSVVWVKSLYFRIKTALVLEITQEGV